MTPDPYTHSSVFRLLCQAKHWRSSYCFTPNDHQVARSFLVLLQPIRRALSKQSFWHRFYLHPLIRQQTILSDDKVSQYLGAGKAAFVCGSCTCLLNRFDTIRWKYEAVKEDLEAQKRDIWHYGRHRHRLSHSHTHMACDSASQSDSSIENLAVWTQIWRWLAKRIHTLQGKANDLGQCLNLWFSALPRECTWPLTPSSLLFQQEETQPGYNTLKFQHNFYC